MRLFSRYLLFKNFDSNIRAIRKTFPKLTKKAPKKCHWLCSGVFIVNFLSLFDTLFGCFHCSGYLLKLEAYSLHIYYKDLLQRFIKKQKCLSITSLVLLLSFMRKKLCQVVNFDNKLLPTTIISFRLIWSIRKRKSHQEDNSHRLLCVIRMKRNPKIKKTWTE